MGRKKAEPEERPPDPPMEENGEDNRNVPVHVCRLGNVKGAVWLNFREDGRNFHAVTFSRFYPLGDGQWGTSTSFGFRDLLLLSEVARCCMHWIAAQASQDVPL